MPEEIIDAWEAMLNTQNETNIIESVITTEEPKTEITIEEVIEAKKALWWEINEDLQWIKQETKTEEEIAKEPEPEKEVKKVDEKEDDKDDNYDDIVYIKSNPEIVNELIKTYQKEVFKYKAEVKERDTLIKAQTKRIEDFETKSISSKYDSDALPVREEKRWLWRMQSKYYNDPDNDAIKNAYTLRLQEELEDVKWFSKTVSMNTVETTQSEPTAWIRFNSWWLVWVKLNKIK